MADISLVAGVASESSQIYAFSPEMEIALDRANMGAPAESASRSSEEGSAGNEGSDEMNPFWALGPGSPVQLTAALMPRTGIEILAFLARSGDATSDLAATIPTGEVPDTAMSLRLQQSTLVGPAAVAETGTDFSSIDDETAQQGTDLSAATSLIALAPVAEPAGEISGFGLPAMRAAAPGASVSDAGDDSLSERLPRLQQLPSSSWSAAPQSGLDSLPPSRPLQARQASPAAAEREIFDATTKFDSGASPEAGAPDLVGLQVDQAADCRSGSPVFEAVLRPQLASQARSGVTSVVLPVSGKSQDISSGLILSGQSEFAAMDLRSSPAELRVTEEPSSDGSPHEQPGSPAESAPSALAAKARTSGDQPSRRGVQDSPAAGLVGNRFSYGTAAADQGGSATQPGDNRRSAEPATAAPIAHTADAEYGGGAGSVLREVSFKVQGADGAAVHLKFTERRGEVHVASRTEDTGLSERLAGELPQLRKAIENSGLSGDIWAAGQEQTLSRGAEPARADAGPNPGNQASAWLRQNDDGSRKQGGQADQWMDQIEDALDGGEGERR